MSQRLPYEDHLKQHWTDLQLPDENKAWEDMKRRLEEDEDRPIIAWWRRGCLLWGLLLLVIFGLGLWLVRDKYLMSGDNKKVTVNKQDEDSNSKRKSSVIIQAIPSDTISGSAQPSKGNETVPLKEITVGVQSIPGGNPVLENNAGSQKKPRLSTHQKENEITNTAHKPVTVPLKPAKNSTNKKNKLPAKSDKLTNENGSVRTNNPLIIKKTDSTAAIPVKDSSVSKTSVKKEPVKSIKSDKQDSLSKSTAKKDLSKKNQLSYSAGISMQQLLPVAGQKTVPYNSQGRKGTLADYIPSIYFRINKERKWFIQGEFRYGAPQYTKEFVYKEDRREDTSGSQTFTTRSSNTLKKTYYHQLPISFNYFVAKDWSVGAGLSWNKFVSAISDREVTRRNNSTTIDSIISKGIVKEKQDSASGFAKSYFQAVIESQYKWKRLSFGARYTFGLQPYLKFTLLNGETGKESNRSLQIFLRYDLWQSKKKK
jgi:hypothetical protein